LGSYVVLPLEVIEKILEIVARCDPDRVDKQLLEWLRLRKPDRKGEWQEVKSRKQSKGKKYKNVDEGIANIAERVVREAKTARENEKRRRHWDYSDHYCPCCWDYSEEYEDDYKWSLLEEQKKEDHYARRLDINPFK